MFYALAGSWEAVWEGASYPVTLPGTLDENNIGYADSGEDQRLPPGERKGGGAPIAGRFTRKHTYEGPVTFRRVVDWQPPQGRRVFFQVGRARHLRLLVDGQEVAPFEEPAARWSSSPTTATPAGPTTPLSIPPPPPTRPRPTGTASWGTWACGMRRRCSCAVCASTPGRKPSPSRWKSPPPRPTGARCPWRPRPWPPRWSGPSPWSPASTCSSWRSCPWPPASGAGTSTRATCTSSSPPSVAAMKRQSALACAPLAPRRAAWPSTAALSSCGGRPTAPSSPRRAIPP